MQGPSVGEILASRARLSAERRAPTSSWLNRIDASAAFLVQIGAHDHSSNYRTQQEPGPTCVAHGWRSLLLEPVPATFERLRQRYELETARVRLLNAAVCDAGCQNLSHTMWTVDEKNQTNWGSNESDARCIAAAAPWLREAASLSARQLLDLGKWFNHKPKWCHKCSEALGRKLPPSCMRNVVSANLRDVEVPCRCLHVELTREPDVTLLLIDVEGHDLEVLRSFPFERTRTARVIYESVHLSEEGRREAARLLLRSGFANVYGGLARDPMVVWHHLNSSERLLSITNQR